MPRASTGTRLCALHATAPLQHADRRNPDNPASSTSCLDLSACRSTDDGKTTFQQGVSSGGALTARRGDERRYIVHPPRACRAPAKHGDVVDSVENPIPDRGVQAEVRRAFCPRWPTPSPTSTRTLEKDPTWHEKNILGSGPFKFVAYETGQSIKGVRNPDYYHEGQPYLDGFTAIFAAKQSVRVDAIRADRAATEFRGMPPSARDELVKELGDKITVQTSDWNCVNLLTPNQKKKPFDDVRVRRAMALAIDPWKGAPALSKIATVHGGRLVFRLAAGGAREELQKIVGFGPDIESRGPGEEAARGGRRYRTR
jgi:peptide/nickel transport system substrate-binding protein